MSLLACPVYGCDASRLPEHAMCASCWVQVPADLRRAVFETWRARRRFPGDRHARMAHLQSLEDADAAVERRAPLDLFGGVHAS